MTTLVDMPLNSIPPSTTVENLRIKREEALNVGVNCDVAFWGGIIPGNSGELRGLLKEGVKGFKCFLIESGVEVRPFSHLLSEPHECQGVPMCQRIASFGSLHRA